MTKVKNYTISEVDTLKPQIKEMLKGLCTYLVNINPVGFEKDGWSGDIDDNGLTFRITKNPVKGLVGEEKDPKFESVIAVININGRPYTIRTDPEDHLNPDTAITEELLDHLADDFIATIVTNMARVWYNNNMRFRLHTLADDKRWEDITSFTEEGIRGHWDNQGYSIIAQNGKDQLICNSHYHKYGKQSSTNLNIDIYKRYLDDAVIFLLAGEFIRKGQVNAPMFLFR